MKKFNIGHRIVFMLIFLFSVLLGISFADLGDIWALPGDVWRVTSSGHLVPGANTTYDVGSSSKMAQSVYAVDLVANRVKVLSPVTVTSNTTLTSNAAQVFIGSINGNRTYVLPSPAIGQVVDIQDTGGNVSVNGNVTIDGAGSNTINGAANVTIEDAFGGLRLVGISTTAWAASKRTTPDAP